MFLRILLLFWVISLTLAFMPYNAFEEKSLSLQVASDSVGQQTPTRSKRAAEREPSDSISRSGIEISNFNIHSDIQYRYSTTYFTSTVINYFSNAAEVNFQVILPENGFISKFCMEIDGVTYAAYVKEKEEAKRVYTEAKESGKSAGLVELKFSNLFDVNVNVHARAIVRFNLTYEELLQRRLGRYELIINITPRQVYNVKNVGITVAIAELPYNKIKAIEIPKLKFNDLEIEQSDDGASGNNLDADIQRISDNKATIEWKPSSDDVKQLKQSREAIGKFILRFEVESTSNTPSEAGDILVMNGYFVHFYSPPNLRSLRKHVVFVLDVSGSMSGRKITQLKEAMKTILADLKKDDFFNIIIFSSEVTHWNPYMISQQRQRRPTQWFNPSDYEGEERVVESQPYSATQDNIEKALKFVSSLYASGGTNINDALQQGLQVSNSAQSGSVLPSGVDSMILFLTDGQPTVSITDLPTIQRNIRNANEEQSIPIFSLAFGSESDFLFLKRLSLQNNGFARKIYEAADAKLQLEGFYKEISSPLLKNVRFTYTNTGNDNYEVTDTTKVKFNTFYHGSEIIIAGKVTPKFDAAVRPSLANAKADSLKSLRQASSYPTQTEPKELFTHFHFYSDFPCIFPVQVYGCGRENKCTTWKTPQIYSYRIWPWRCPPPPQYVTTQPPRAPPSREDFFLERYWAYLTIQQLLDNDFMSDSSALKPSDSRSMALKLSLEYGFVTPLTSLVVVKPDEPIYLAEPIPIDDFGKQGKDSASQKGTANGGGALAGGSGSSFRQSVPASATYSDSGSSGDSESASSSKRGKPAVPPPRRDDDWYLATKSKPFEESTTSSYYTLKDIEWLPAPPYEIDIDGNSYQILVQEEKLVELVEKSCTIMNGRKKTPGQCKHLKDCVQEEFLEDFNVYKKYFCKAKAKNTPKLYAGACCPTS